VWITARSVDIDALFLPTAIILGKSSNTRFKFKELNQGSFPVGTPRNGVPKDILAVGTAFPGK